MAEPTPDPNTTATAPPDARRPPRGPVPPEHTVAWQIDGKHALYDAAFTYPGQRSFFNGVNKLSNEHLDGYIDARGELAGARRAVNEAAHRLEALRTQAKAIGDDELNVRATHERERITVARLEAATAELNESHTTRKARIVDLQRRLHSPVRGLSLPVALLFTLGFFLFASADFAIARNIAYTVLDFDPQEALILGLSIACMPLILKPFVERFVEKGYHDGTTIRFTKGFYATVGVLVLLYLAVFGYVRYREELLNAEREAFTITADAQRGQAILSGATYVERPWVLSADQYWHRALLYCLSGVLAAIGGAICLAMAFGPMPEYLRRLRYWQAVIRKRLGLRLLPHRGRLSAKLANARTQLKLREEQVGLHGRVAAAEDAFLRAQRDEFATASRLIRAYNADEFQRGSAYQLDGPLRVNPSWMETEDPDDEKGSTGDRRERNRPPQNPRSSPPRNGYLHERLRHHIQNRNFANPAP